MIEYVSKTDAMTICAGHDGLAFAIFKMKPDDVLPYTIDPDGTLTITVPKGTTVNRVLIQEDGRQWGRLFYAD